METRSSMSRSLHINRDLEKLEPYEGKPSCTVLRGEEGSNALDLPDLPCCPEMSIRQANYLSHFLQPLKIAEPMRLDPKHIRELMKP